MFAAERLGLVFPDLHARRGHNKGLSFFLFGGTVAVDWLVSSTPDSEQLAVPKAQ